MVMDRNAAHLAGWATGNLQHHLIHDHGVSPSEIPYNKRTLMDDLHELKHGAHTPAGTPGLRVTPVIAVGGPFGGTVLEIHGPVQDALQLPWSESEAEPLAAGGEDPAKAVVEYESHLYLLGQWRFAGAKVWMYRHSSVQTPDEINTELARALFPPVVFTEWERAHRAAKAEKN